MSLASGRGMDERIHTPHSPFVSATPLQESNLLSHSEIVKAITDRIHKVKEPIRLNCLVAYEFLEESQGGWRWSIGQVKELTEHSVSIQKWRCEHGNNNDLIDALRRDQLVKTKLLKESSQSIFSLRAELGSVRTKNESEMARVRSELEERQKPLSVADDGVWTAVLRCAGTGKPQARGLSILITTVVRLVDQRDTTQALSWVDVARAAQHPTFLDRLYRYDVWYDMSTEQFECAKALLEEHNDLKPANFDQALREISPNSEVQAYIEALYMWLKAQVQAFTTYLECASTQEYANSLQQQLFECVQNLKELNRKMAQIKEQLALYANGGAGMDAKVGGNESYTFVPTNGIYATLLRSSIIFPLREKSTEIAVLGKEDIEEILECAGHHRPSLHLVVGEMLQANASASEVPGTKEQDIARQDETDVLKKRVADLQSQNEALRDEIYDLEKEVQELKKKPLREADGDNETDRIKRMKDEEHSTRSMINNEIKRLKEDLHNAEKEVKKLEDDLRDAEKRNTKLNDEIHDAEKEKKKLKNDLRDAEKEVKKLKDEARDAERKNRQTDSGKRDRDLEKENKKLKDDLRDAEKEIRRLKDEARNDERRIPRARRDNSISSGSGQRRQESGKVQDLEERLRKSQDENKKLRNQIRELEKMMQSKNSRSSSVSTWRSSPFEQLLLEEKCDRLKIERVMVQKWSSLLSFERDTVVALNEKQTHNLLEELDLLSGDYTDSLEKLEDFIVYLDEARRSEKKLRDRLASRENELFSLQASQDAHSTPVSRSHRSGPMRSASSSETLRSEKYPLDHFDLKRRVSQLQKDNEELLSVIKNVAEGHRNKEKLTPQRERSSLGSHSSIRGDGDQTAFAEAFLRMRGQIEQLKQEREALHVELAERDSEIEELNQRTITHIDELNDKIEGSCRSAEHMKIMLKDIVDLRRKRHN